MNQENIFRCLMESYHSYDEVLLELRYQGKVCGLVCEITDDEQVYIRNSEGMKRIEIGCIKQAWLLAS